MLRVFRCMGSILPARHGDAALDAVGVLHRVLWLRPDAERARAPGADARARRDGDPLLSLDAGEIERVDRPGPRPRPGRPIPQSALRRARPGGCVFLRGATTRRRGGGHAEYQPESEADEQCDPDDLWDWHPRDCWMVRERAPRRAVPPVQVAPETTGARCGACARRRRSASPSTACSPACERTCPPGPRATAAAPPGGPWRARRPVHALRALRGPGHSGRAGQARARADARTFETRTMWRQLRVAQMRELVEQLACVVETRARARAHFGWAATTTTRRRRRRRRRRLKTQMKNRSGGRARARISDDYSGAFGAGSRRWSRRKGEMRRRGGRVDGCVQRDDTPPVSVENARGTPGLRRGMERGDARVGLAVFVRVRDVLHGVPARGERGLRHEAAHVHAERRVFVARARLRDARRVAGGRADRYASNHVPGRRDRGARRRDCAQETDASRPKIEGFTKKKKNVRVGREKRKKRAGAAWREKTAKRLAGREAEARKAKRSRRDAARASESPDAAQSAVCDTRHGTRRGCRVERSTAATPPTPAPPTPTSLGLLRRARRTCWRRRRSRQGSAPPPPRLASASATTASAEWDELGREPDRRAYDQ